MGAGLANSGNPSAPQTYHRGRVGCRRGRPRRGLISISPDVDLENPLAPPLSLPSTCNFQDPGPAGGPAPLSPGQGPPGRPRGWRAATPALDAQVPIGAADTTVSPQGGGRTFWSKAAPTGEATPLLRWDTRRPSQFARPLPCSERRGGGPLAINRAAADRRAVTPEWDSSNTSYGPAAWYCCLVFSW
jgi:hypothetical protein